jgi:hypothetical protein
VECGAASTTEIETALGHPLEQAEARLTRGLAP